MAPEKFRTKFRVKYSVGEAFRYAAHLDIVRAVYRALRRSELPVAYSQGFSPRPVVAFGPPLPVGLTSAEEYLDLQMAGHYPGDLVRDLGPAMPRDLHVLDARPVFTKVGSLGAGLVAARYAVQARDLSDADHVGARARVAAIPGVRQLDFLEQAGPGVNFDLVLAMTPGVKLFPRCNDFSSAMRQSCGAGEFSVVPASWSAMANLFHQWRDYEIRVKGQESRVRSPRTAQATSYKLQAQKQLAACGLRLAARGFLLSGGIVSHRYSGRLGRRDEREREQLFDARSKDMKSEIILSSNQWETRLALVEDGLLVQLHVERAEKTNLVGRIDKAETENVVKRGAARRVREHRPAQERVPAPGRDTGVRRVRT